jgi:hypothetical protein
MAVDAVRPSRPRLPPLPQRVAAVVSSSDPGLTWVSDGRGRLLLGGVAAGLDADGEGAEISLSFDGARICAYVKPGTTAAQAVELLEKALPEGYRLSLSAASSGEVMLELIRSPNAPRPPQSQRAEDPAIPYSDACSG